MWGWGAGGGGGGGGGWCVGMIAGGTTEAPYTYNLGGTSDAGLESITAAEGGQAGSVWLTAFHSHYKTQGLEFLSTCCVTQAVTDSVKTCELAFTGDTSPLKGKLLPDVACSHVTLL